ncbi:MAG TPA: WhiB family transcriptional regulator [Pseudomonadales bacterium]|nr:WhiB family transcriptional regulator [Pseudomonadales bacterium]
MPRISEDILTDMTNETWRQQAACFGHDPEMFFPIGLNDVNPEALAICQSCPVRLQCLDHAIQNNYASGIWGGERFSVGRRHRAIRDRNRRAA